MKSEEYRSLLANEIDKKKIRNWEKIANDLWKFIQLDISTYLYIYIMLSWLFVPSHMCQYTRNLLVYITTHYLYKILIEWICNDTEWTKKRKKTSVLQRIKKKSVITEYYQFLNHRLVPLLTVYSFLWLLNLWVKLGLIKIA